MLASSGFAEGVAEFPHASMTDLPYGPPGSTKGISEKKILLLQQRISAQEEYIAGLKEAASRSIVSQHRPFFLAPNVFFTLQKNGKVLSIGFCSFDRAIFC
jgi:hypothetical protein